MRRVGLLTRWARAWAEARGQQVENVGGAGGNIGMLQAARATPDAYTLTCWGLA